MAHFDIVSATRAVLDRPHCRQCGGPLTLLSLTTVVPHMVQRTFECPACDSAKDGRDSGLRLTMKDAKGPTGIGRPCSRCGGKLVFKDTCESPKTGSPVHFFRCEDCGHVQSVERRSA